MCSISVMRVRRSSFILSQNRSQARFVGIIDQLTLIWGVGGSLDLLPDAQSGLQRRHMGVGRGACSDLPLGNCSVTDIQEFRERPLR
jgi:hypothetical protein